MDKTSQLDDPLSSVAANAGLAGVRFALGWRRTRRSGTGSVPFGESTWPRFESNRNVAAWPGCGSCLSWSSPAASSTTSCTID